MATVELKENHAWKEFTRADYSIVDCYGDDCVACVMLEPVYDGVADEMGQIAFGRVNIMHYPDIADTYGISAMPTLLYFRRGELISKTIGNIEREELLENIAKTVISVRRDHGKSTFKRRL